MAKTRRQCAICNKQTDLIFFYELVGRSFRKLAWCKDCKEKGFCLCVICKTWMVNLVHIIPENPRDEKNENRPKHGFCKDCKEKGLKVLEQPGIIFYDLFMKNHLENKYVN